MPIIKTVVAKGITWVEIPEADLRILCGCPMDSVKHLMKRGLIVSTEKNGVNCETGPNAILLSDLMLQNGEMANLGEFPVLQMLYKQGLILPNHPNNTGQKPLIIGLAEQVNAQMQYIYRGNYGLISREEIEEAGVSTQEAAAMMRLKLRFAFGTIRPSQDLLEGRVVGDELVEIRNGVMIRRQSQNLYVIEYANSRITVDLNLPPGESYESAYPLGFQMLPREYFAIVHSGEGDGWDVNRPSMSSILMFHGKIYLIDAGPNLFNNLEALGIGIDEIAGIFHTHAHDDHFAGVTTLIRSGRKVKYFATRLVRATVEKKLSALLSFEEERFQEFFEVHDLQPETWNDIEGLEVRPVYSPHPLETSIFLFRTLWQNGYRTYAHFADIVSLELLEKMITDDPGKPGIDRAYFKKIRDEYLTPVNLKKLDVGGGMIHGMAQDFREDASDRILLSHVARELTPWEREIGSSAPHGMMDVLISGESDFARRSAFTFLQSAFPGIPLHQLRILINSPVIHLKPGTMLLREGGIPEKIQLILTGAVEKIRTRDRFVGRLSSGAMVGEESGLHNQPSRYTYSTVSHVQALEITASLYRELVLRNNLLERIERTAEWRLFLQSTPLFSEGVPYPILDQVVDAIELRIFPAGQLLACRDLNRLNLIRSGQVERSLAGERFDVLQSRDYFGEEMTVFETPCLFRLTTLEETEVCQIPGELVQEIPIVRWKLFEAYHNRAMQVVHTSDSAGSFRWNSAFNIQISEMDIHHKKLLEIANAIMEIVRSGAGWSAMESAFAALVHYTEYHFSAEERLMERYGYPELVRHQSRHRSLVQQVLEYRDQMMRQPDTSQIDFKSFFSQWLVRHIMSEDRQYSAFLNAKGVY
ncbi:MAG: bacteriohemerythrin [Magnetococcales bacterium]|nr:bacteriohemerythrin [Magnetococcales bacterium]